MEILRPESSTCPDCGGSLLVRVRACPACGLACHGDLPYPRLARLGTEERRLAEDFLLTGGNLSELARVYSISRPTARQRLDALLDRLRALRDHDEAECERVLKQVESGAITPERAARTLRELQT